MKTSNWVVRVTRSTEEDMNLKFYAKNLHWEKKNECKRDVLLGMTKYYERDIEVHSHNHYYRENH
jgi:hypothetical protein